jgi:hypothetical protein
LPKIPARKLADLAEREAAAAVKERELARYQSDIEEYKRTIDQFKVDPLGALEKAGLTYEQLTIEALKGKKNQSPNPEIEALRDELKKGFDDIRFAEQERQLSAAKSQLKAHVEQLSDKYELINARGDYDQVWDVMVEITKQSGGARVPTFDEAAEFYESQLEKELDKYMSTKKVQSKIQKPPAEKVEIADKQPGRSALNNKVGAPIVKQEPAKPRSKKEAFAAFRNLVDKSYANSLKGR